MDKLWQVSAEWTRGEEQRDHSLIKSVIPDAELLLVLNGHLRLLAPKRCGTYAFLFGSMREGVSQSGSLPKEWNGTPSKRVNPSRGRSALGNGISFLSS